MQAEQAPIKVSIVVPCYNTERYLPRCLDSLLAQTLSPIEVICVNDGSPDESLSLLRRYKQAHPGIIRVVDRDNGGLWNARWSGTDVARGTYVAYVDSDDWVDPTFAEDFWETGEREGADIVVCGFRRTVEETGAVLSSEMAGTRPSFLAHEEPGRLIEVNPAAWNKAWRHDLLLRMHRLEHVPPILEDVSLSQLGFLASKNRPIAFTGGATYNYMVHEGSMINTVTPTQVEAVKRMLLEVRADFEADGASAELLQALDATAFLHLGVSMSFRLSSSPDIDLSESITATTRYLDEHFPTWRHSPFITPAYAREHGSAYQKLLLAQWFYKAHLMRPFLACYRFAIERLGIDIKW